MSRKRVVIVGAGFAGLNAAKALKRAPVLITIVDRRNFHLFQPLLYQVATAALNPSDIAYPIRSVFKRQATVDAILMAEVVDIDTGSHTVRLDDGSRIGYDYLLLATGAAHSYLGRDEWKENAPGLKTVEDALTIRGRVLEAFEKAEREPKRADGSASSSSGPAQPVSSWRERWPRSRSTPWATSSTSSIRPVPG